MWFRPRVDEKAHALEREAAPCDSSHVRRFLVLGSLLAACSRPVPHDDFTLKIAVVGALAPLGHDVHATASTCAQDLVYEAILRPEGAGLRSRVLARWERAGARGLRALVADGLRFSDGLPVEVGDVARSIRAAGLTVREDGRWLEIEPGRDGLPVEAALLMAALFKPTPAGDLGTAPFRLASGDERRLVVDRVAPMPGRIRRVELIAFPTAREAFARTLKREANAVISLDDRQVDLADGVPGLSIVRARGPHALALLMNPRRLGPRLRREIAEALPLEEIEELAQGKGCGPPSGRRQPAPLPDGAPLEVTIVAVESATERAGLAIRRGLGARGGDLARLGTGEGWRARVDRDLTVDSVLVWPPIIGALYWKTNAPWNSAGYSNHAYDAAVEASDFDRAEAELKSDPPLLLFCRRERIAAVDARLKNATLGSWGLLDTLPDWEVSP